MYAIVEIAGHQYKVQKDQRLYVNRLEGEAGAKLTFDRVLLTDDNGKVEVGAPVIEGVAVNATILEHLKADKVIVFKKKRRKGYKKKNGHRQAITSIEITGFGKPAAKKAAPKKEAAAKTEEAPKAEAKKPAAKKTTTKKASEAKTDAKPAAKKTTAAKKSTTAKKPAAKKTTAKKADDKKSEE
ncbi:MAG: 50S ribosomal protein L21 [Flavobacteriia bacterium]|nr:50S ribosomal protein L21 [Flavobacteriia bacterium]